MIPTETMHATAARPRHGLLWQSLVEDARGAWRHVVLGRLAASPLTPRVARYLVHRAMGLRVATANIWPRCTIVGSELSIGDGTFVNQQCFFEAVAPIRIGRHCQIGMAAMIVTSHHEIGEFGAGAVVDYRPVTIGDGVWLGARSLILPGVTVGDRVVVAAGAVVTRDLIEPALYAGVPARRIRGL